MNIDKEKLFKSFKEYFELYFEFGIDFKLNDNIYNLINEHYVNCIKEYLDNFKQLNYIPFNANFSKYNYRHYLLSHFDLCIDLSIYRKLFLNKLDKFKITFCSINTLLFTNMIDICIDNYHI